jgi:RNA polymerase sigma-70 factor, ECF subfamily
VGDLAERAFRRHYRHVYHYIRRRAASADEAEDLTQAVFADTVAVADRLRVGSPPLLAWLYTVAKRRLADEARRLERGPVQVAPLDASGPAAPQAQYGEEVARALRSGLARMPDDQRRVVVWRLLEGRGFAEISRRLGTSEACRMRFVRGLRALREEFERGGATP